MSNKNFLEEKFIELNELKSMLITYPEEYKENILQVMEKVCNQISSYIEDVKFYNKKRGRNLIELTTEELAKYNGKNEMPAYIAVNDTVYDVCDIPQWKEGMHFGIKAGLDHSETFKSCHNNSMDILSKLRVVGVMKYAERCILEE